MKTKLATIAVTTKQLDNSRSAQLYSLNNKNDGEKLAKLLENSPRIRVIDELQSQLTELIKLRYPKEKHSDAETQILIKQHLNGIPEEKYGVWAYYQWNNTLVHILDRDEFYEVKTNRNQHKITREESEILGKQIVGVVGLSVGRTIAITMTMEHSYGEIRIADFDVLELSNYNRIRAALTDLGVKKTISLAREIAEIDPYVKVVCFNGGITDDNIDAFFTQGGRLNVLVDECDGLDIKILLREKAKALRIPVIMDMNDRGTMDIERFDLEPGRPLLHGYIGHLDSSKLKGLTNEQKIPYIMPMLGENTISTKLKASMLEIEQTLTTWPQLAADVTLGGAVAANVYRRIVLDEFHDSGRYFIDMDDLIRDKDIKAFTSFQPDKYVRVNDLNKSSIESKLEALKLSTSEGQISLSKDQLNNLITAANQASSTANVQPWKWAYYSECLVLFHDSKVAESFGDFQNIGSNLSYGAALENLVQQAQHDGLSLSIETATTGNQGSHHVAIVRFFERDKGSEKLLQENLAQHIFQRCTNRTKSNYSPIEDGITSVLKSTANSINGVSLKLFTDPEIIKAAGKLIGRADKLRFFNKEGHKDFFWREARWTPEESEETGDGIDLRTAEMSDAEITGMKMARNYDVVKQMQAWNGGGAFEKTAIDSFEGASAIGLFCVDSYSPDNALKVGRSLERTWLKATEMNISIQPWMSIVFHFHRLMTGDGIGMDPTFKREAQKLRREYESLFGLDNTFKELFLIRFFNGDEPSTKSIRKPLEEVLFDFGNNE
ncbi:MAG: Rv1355c family protein [Crocinitomicaceae bacterium]|nr:Rv1355c family protein [Crocinitomicaceae bacterium]